MCEKGEIKKENSALHVKFLFLPRMLKKILRGSLKNVEEFSTMFGKIRKFYVFPMENEDEFILCFEEFWVCFVFHEGFDEVVVFL